MNKSINQQIINALIVCPTVSVQNSFVRPICGIDKENIEAAAED